MKFLMSEKEFNERLTATESRGIALGRQQIMNAVNLCMTGQAEKVTVTENAEKEIKEFVEKLKEFTGSIQTVQESKTETEELPVVPPT